MKKYSFLFFAILTLVIESCNNVQKTNDKVMTQTIEVVAPKAMYEILLKDPSAQLVDVRTKDEFAVSHLKDAQNICVTDNDFKQKVAFLDRSKPVYVYCKSGGRSGKTAKLLSKLGQYEVYNLSGGLMAWEKANYPIVAMADIADEHIKSFSISDFDSLLQVHQKVLVDFHTQWCVPCRKMVPIVDALEVELKEQVFVLRIDLDQSKDLADKYNITSVPTFLLFNNAAEVWRQAGLMTKDALVEQVL